MKPEKKKEEKMVHSFGPAQLITGIFVCTKGPRAQDEKKKIRPRAEHILYA